MDHALRVCSACAKYCRKHAAPDVSQWILELFWRGVEAWGLFQCSKRIIWVPPLLLRDTPHVATLVWPFLLSASFETLFCCNFTAARLYYRGVVTLLCALQMVGTVFGSAIFLDLLMVWTD